MDNPLLWVAGAILGALAIIYAALDSADREQRFKPSTPYEWASGATPDDTDETQF